MKQILLMIFALFSLLVGVDDVSAQRSQRVRGAKSMSSSIDENGDLPKWVKTGLVVLASVATVAVIAATSGLAGPVLIGAGASSLISLGTSVVTQKVVDKKIDWNQVFVDTAIGAVMGAFGGSALSQLGMMFAGGGSGFISSVASDWVKGESIDRESIMNAVDSAVISSLFA